MLFRKIVYISYLTFSLGFIYAENAKSQEVDANLQSTVESLTVLPEAGVIGTEVIRVPVERKKTIVETKSVIVKIPLERRKKIAEERGYFAPLAVQKGKPEEFEKFLDSMKIPKTETKIVKKRRVKTTIEVVEKPKPRTTEIILATPGSYRYESNANKTRTDLDEDWIISTGAAAILRIPVGTALDTLSFSANPTIVRYDKLETKDLDLISLGVVYATVPNRSFSSSLGQNGPETRDTLSFGISSLSVFAPGFEERKVTFNKPALSWSRSNIPLRPDLCGSDKKKYCYFATVSANANYTFSDVASVENAAVEFGIKFGWNTPVPGLSLISGAKAQGKYFPNTNDGRQDLLAILNGGFGWSPSPNLTVKAEINYTWQASSQRSAEWDGFGFTPTVTLSAKF